MLNPNMHSFASAAVKEKLKGLDAKRSEQVRLDLQAAVQKTLKLGDNVERRWIINKDFVPCLIQFGAGADVWLPVKNPGWCDHQE